MWEVEAAPLLPKDLNPDFYKDLVIAVLVSELAPDGTISNPVLRWVLAASTGEEITTSEWGDREKVIEKANSVIVQRTALCVGPRVLMTRASVRIYQVVIKE